MISTLTTKELEIDNYFKTLICHGGRLTCRGISPDLRYEELDPLVQSLVGRIPDRLVWGLDWPHATESDKPDDARLL